MDFKKLILISLALFAMIFAISSVNDEDASADTTPYIQVLGTAVYDTVNDDVLGDQTVSFKFEDETAYLTLTDAELYADASTKVANKAYISTDYKLVIKLIGHSILKLPAVADDSYVANFGIFSKISIDITYEEGNSSSLTIESEDACINCSMLTISAPVYFSSLKTALTGTVEIDKGNAFVTGKTRAADYEVGLKKDSGLVMRASETLSSSLEDYDKSKQKSYKVIAIDADCIVINGKTMTEDDHTITEESGSADYDFDTNTLTLTNFTISIGEEHISAITQSSATIGIYSSKDMIIQVTGECAVADDIGICVLGSVTVCNISEAETSKITIADGICSLSSLEFNNTTVTVNDSIRSMGSIEIDMCNLTVSSDEVIDGFSAVGNILVGNESVVTVSSCSEFLSQANINFSGCTVTLKSVISFTANDIIIQSATVNITVTGTGVEAANDIELHNSKITITHNIEDSSVAPVALNALNSLTIEGGELKIAVESSISDLETVVGMMSNIIFISKSAAMDITVDTGDRRIGISSENNILIDVVKMSGDDLDTEPMMEIDLGSSSGNSVGIQSENGDISISGSILIQNSSAKYVRAIQAENVTVEEYGFIQINICGKSNPTVGISADSSVTFGTAYSASINVVCNNADTPAYGIKTETFEMTDGTLTINADSGAGAYGLKAETADIADSDKIDIKVGSSSSAICGISVDSTLTVKCADLNIGICNGDYSGDVTGISAKTGEMDVAGAITLVSSEKCIGIKADTSLIMNGSGTLKINMSGTDVTGILVSNGTLDLNDTFTLDMELTGPGTHTVSSLYAIDVKTTVTMNGTSTVRTKSKNSTSGNGIHADELMMNGGFIQIECSEKAIETDSKITAENYVSSHTNETFISGITKVLTPKTDETVKFGIGVLITIESSNTDNGTVDVGKITVPIGSTIHIDENVLTAGGIDSTATPTESDSRYLFAFVSWSVEDGTAVTEAITVTATFSKTAQSYTVKFLLMEGECVSEPGEEWTPIMSESKIIGYERIMQYGDELTAIPDAWKYGYTFTGWDPSVPPTVQDSDVTYKAQYDINTYAVNITISGVGTSVQYKIDENDPETYDPEDPPIVAYGSKVTILINDLHGYTYKMYLDSEEVSDNYFIMPDQPVTFSVVYTPNTHTVTLYLNGGYYESTPTGWTAVTGVGSTIIGYIRNVDYATILSDIIPDGPLKKGWKFTEWTSDEEIPEYMPDNNLYLTADYMKMKYKVTVIIEGANGSVTYSNAGSEPKDYTAPFDVYYGDVVDLAANPVYQYTSELISDDALITEGSFTMPDQSVTVYAVYTVIQHTLTVMLNGGSISDISEEWTPIKDGLKTVGYSRSFGYDGTVVSPGTPYKNGYSFAAWDPEMPASMPAYDLTLNATYEVEYYTVAFSVSGASGTLKYTIDDGEAADYTGPFQAMFGTKITVIPSAVDHYHTAVVSDDVLIDDHSFIVPSNKVDACVEYILDSKTVTIILNGGSYDKDPDGWTRYTDEKGKFVGYQKDFGYGTALVLPEPLLSGHDFIGWEPDVPERMPDEYLRFEAKYSLSRYNITIDSSIEGMKYTVNGGEETVYTAPFEAAYGAYISVIVPSVPGYTAKLSSADTQVGYTNFYVPAHDVNAALCYEVSNNLVTISTSMPNAVITYTVDDGESTVYSRPFYVKSGQTVTMKSNSISGYEKAEFSSEQAEINEGTFTMGDTEVNVTVTYIGSFFKLNLSMNGGYYEKDPEGWTPIKNAEGVTTGYTKEFRCNTLITYPENPLKTGYTFTVWSPQVALMPAQDTNISAKYTPNQYTLKWYSEGEIYLEEQAYYDSTIVPPADPKKQETEQSSFEFKQWIGLTDGMKVTGDASFTAEFKTIAKTYTVAEGKVAEVDTDTSSMKIPSSVIGLVQQDVRNKAVTTMSVSVLAGSITIGSDSINAISDTLELAIYGVTPTVVPEALKELIKGRPVYDITTNASGEMTVSFRYILAEGESADGLYIAYLKSDGTYQKMDSKYSDGEISFTTDHNSEYAIIYEEPVKTEDKTLLYIGIGAGVVIGILIVAYFVRRYLKTRKF